MNARIIGLGILTALFGVVGSTAANELVVTPVMSKSGQVSMAFDIASAGDVAGFNFKVNMPGLVKRGGEQASCVAELPRGFSGACSIQDGGIYVFAVSDSPSFSLPAGVTSVGKISVNYAESLAKAGGRNAFSISELAFYDNQAAPLSVKAQVDTSSLINLKPARNAQ